MYKRRTKKPKGGALKYSNIEKLAIVIFIGLLIFAYFNNKPQENYKYKPNSQIEFMKGE